jgi:hypothetical protein
LTSQIAAWIAPAATTVAALMTAANLGTRVTGWGFAVFTIGSVAWSAYALGTGQEGLLWQNLFLTAVNLIGVWRWLGRQATLDRGADIARDTSAATPGPTLFPVSTLASTAVMHGEETLGTAVDAMIRCDDGGIEYLVLSRGGFGGVGETLRALPWTSIRIKLEEVSSTLSAEQIEALPEVDRSAWPAKATATA